VNVAIRCPKCFGENVEPQGETWFCRHCNLSFNEAALVMPPPARPAPKRPKRPPQ
jgi:ribosomal protein L37AE/L43A